MLNSEADIMLSLMWQPKHSSLTKITRPRHNFHREITQSNEYIAGKNVVCLIETCKSLSHCIPEGPFPDLKELFGILRNGLI